MKKKYLILGSCFALLPFSLKAQLVKDTAARKVKKTEIELVYNHYLQDGDNSAVTGGVGTEKLVVYGPSLTVKNTFNKNALSFKLGADIISSASTDNIDFIKSSASALDVRSFANITYERQLEKKNSSIYGGIGLSIESDYLSIASKLGFTKNDEINLRAYSFQFQMFNDDLRWGRINPDYFEPVELVYPVELRFKEWHDEYRRNSYNLKLGLTQVINKRNILGVFPELTFQQGLLATPFHRIYFTDEMQAVENLPSQRYKGALAIRLNTFSGGRLIFKSSISGYVDNFGITAIGIENETAIKLKPFLVLLPNFRFYAQNGSKYFAPYLEHKANEEYYTSDYDLSKFETYNVGIGVKHSSHKNMEQKSKTFIFRYNFLYRTNELRGHSFSIVFQSSYSRR